MNIAIVTNSFPTVGETFISNKVKALAARGHVIRVFTTKKNKALFNQLFSEKSNVSVAELNIKDAAFHSILYPLQTVKSLTATNKKRHLFNAFRLHLLRQFKPDIIHFEFSGVGVEYLPLFQKLPGKKVVSCRGSAEKVKLLTDVERQKNFKLLMKAVDAVHCVSADMRDTIKEYADTNKMFINYPSIDTQVFNRTTAYTTNEIPVILSIGRFTFQKNYLIGLLAMRCLADKNIAFKWLIVGSGRQYEEIVFHIHQLQLQNHVELIGTKSSEEIRSLMERADIFFLPSLYEGIANAALEAMSMQLPVVATNSGGMPEVITCCKDGLLAGVYDFEKLAAHMLYLVNNPERAKEIGIAARERVVAQFSLQQQTAIFEQIYQQLTTA